MKKFFLIFILSYSIIFPIYAISATQNTTPSTCLTSNRFEEMLLCAQKNFFIAGEPINPRIIQDLLGWLSDTGDQITAIDLLGSQRSNRYFYNHSSLKKSGAYFSMTATYGHSSFSYDLKGITANGIIVLHTKSWEDDGTGVFNDILLVRIREGVSFGTMTHGLLKMDQRKILIEKLGNIPLGDRVLAEISIEQNTITIHKKDTKPHEQMSGTEKITLSLDNQ